MGLVQFPVMDDSRLDRRSFLAAASAGLASVAAGCLEPRADDSIEGNSSHEIDRGALADGSAFTDLYEAIIDSVTQIRVFGLRDPTTGAEGRGQGSGFVYDDRHIVTNDHVIGNGTAADLQYTNGDWTGPHSSVATTTAIWPFSRPITSRRRHLRFP